VTLQADLIVEGKVSAIDEAAGTFELAVSQVLAGPDEPTRLDVNQLRNWPCASRYGPYAVGQMGLFFLRRIRDEDGKVLDRPLTVLGLGNEGECPVDGDEVLLSGPGWTGSPYEMRAGFGSERWMVASRREVVSAVQSLRESFQWKYYLTGRDHFPVSSLRQTCTEAELEARMSSSRMMKYMVEWHRGIRPGPTGR
jgi:hypothetical protein